MNKEVAYGLVLEGPVTMGAYQLGALRALKTHGIHITCIVGQSIGAFNGALYCQNDIDLGYKLWESFKLENLIGTDISMLKHVIHETINEEKVRKCGIEFGLITFDLKEKISVDVFLEQIPNGKLSAFILSSTYSPKDLNASYESKPYYEGGFFNNSPIQMLLKKNYKNILVVKPVDQSIQQSSYDAFDKNVIIIKPKEIFKNESAQHHHQIRNYLQSGYYDTLSVIENLKGSHYYIGGVPDDHRIISQWGRINKEETLVLKSMWPSLIGAPSRYLFEEVLKHVVEFLGLSQQWSYESLLIGIIEFFALKFEYRQYKTYQYGHILPELVKQIKGYKKEQPSEIALEVLLKLMLRE
jgi:NTE family protein